MNTLDKLFLLALNLSESNNGTPLLYIVPVKVVMVEDTLNIGLDAYKLPDPSLRLTVYVE